MFKIEDLCIGDILIWKAGMSRALIKARITNLSVNSLDTYFRRKLVQVIIIESTIQRYKVGDRRIFRIHKNPSDREYFWDLEPDLDWWRIWGQDV
ncbi:MAG: hypothetical protein ACXABY_08765 [Candidatus Thorarchaeota archaeon]|jgi:sugar-specific transcriptional regulator TrmB